MIISVLISLVSILLVLIWGLLFRGGIYKYYVFLAVIARLFLIYLVEVAQIIPMGDLIDYVPYFERFAIESQGRTLIWIFSTSAEFYTQLYPGFIFATVGLDNIWVIRVVNSMLSILLLGPSVAIYEAVFNRRPTAILPILVLFWPPYLRFSISVGRTVPGVLFIVAGVFFLLKIIGGKVRASEILQYVVYVLSIFAAVMIRPAHLAFFLPLMLIYLLSIANYLSRSIEIRTLMTVLFSMFGFAVAYVLIGAYNQIAAQAQIANLDVLAERAMVINSGATAYLNGVYPRSPLDFVWFLPIHAVYFLFSPMPWHAMAASTPLAWLSVLFAWLTLYWFLQLIYRRRKYFSNNKLLKCLILTLVFSATVMGAGVKNAGSAERWRYPITNMLLIVFSGTVLLRSNRNSLDAFVSER